MASFEVSSGEDFLVERLDRGVGGRRTTLLKVDGRTGQVDLAGTVKINGLDPADPRSPPPYVLYGSGPLNGVGAGAHVNCGPFWQQSVASGAANIGSWRLEFLARPDTLLGGYVISDSQGGGHAQLCGFVPDGNGYLALEGDTRTDSGGMDFQSQPCDKIIPGQWVYGSTTANLSGVGGRYQVIRVEGIPVSVEPFVGNRISDTFGSDGVCHIMGSNHQNLQGALAYVSLWDGNKLAFPNPTDSGQLFRAERVNDFPAILQGGDYSDLALDCTVPGTLVPDRAVGLTGPMGPTAASANYRGAAQHHGVLEFSLPPEQTLGIGTRPKPYWVLDPACPIYLPMDVGGGPRRIAGFPGYVQVRPPNAKIWDDFWDKHSTFATTSVPTIGFTLGNGAQLWQTRPDDTSNCFRWGVFRGHAYYSGQAYAPAVPTWVTNNSTDMDVQIEIPLDSQITRNPALLCGEAVTFRVGSATSYWVAWLSQNGQMQLTSYNAGTPTDVGSTVPMPVGYTHLRAVAQGTTISIYGGVRSGNNIVWGSAIKTTTSSFLQGSLGAGMAAYGGATGRFRNFAVY